jgi:starch-binding outer membrane protein, SusD/RagB family
MKNKIYQFLILGILLFNSCSEDFITKDVDKSRYIPSTFYNTKSHAIQALNAAYSGSNAFGSGYSWSIGIMNFVLGDELWQTGYAAGFGTWGPTSDFNITNTAGEVSDTWNGYYNNILFCNNALEVMPTAQKADPLFTQDELNLYMGQAYFLRAFNYYCLYQYFPQDKIVVRESVPKTDADFAKAPSSAEATFAFIESDLKKAEELLGPGLNTTTGYDKGRATRGSAAALLGKLYINSNRYAEAADEFKKVLPGVADASYGTYALTPNYRDNFTTANENNSESLWEIQYANVNQKSGFDNNDLNWITQNFTLNRTAYPDMWWNFAVPNFKLNEFENWTETIAGAPTTVYDYRVYETFWGVPNGADFTYKGDVRDWQKQGWDKEILLGSNGVYGIRKYAIDNTTEEPTGAGATWSDVNIRIIRLADVMLLYAECMANINPSNVAPGDVNSAIYWIDQVRNRANNVASDQAHLYSTRAGEEGQLPSASALMAAKGWTLLQLIQHERYVEGYCEGWRKEDLKRWKVDANFVQNKPGFKGYQSLILPVPQSELDNNPNMPR